MWQTKGNISNQNFDVQMANMLMVNPNLMEDLNNLAALFVWF